MLLSVLGLTKDTKHAIYHTRYDDKLLLPNTRNTLVGDPKKSKYYNNGYEITKKQDGTYHLISWTIVRANHVFNFGCFVDTNFNVIDGTINTFSWGYTNIDQGYIDDHIESWKSLPVQWDFIE